MYMLLKDRLKNVNADYEMSEHPIAFTAQQTAFVEHVKGMNVAKPVIVIADGVYYMCVVAACCKVDYDALKSVLQADNVQLVYEDELASLSPDCQLGAEPPFGSFYGMPTIMDDRLEADDFIVFQAGTHDKAMRMEMAEYLRIETPRIFSFSYHLK